MERNFLGGIVRQEHLTGYFCINDMTSIGNIYRKNKGLPDVRWDKYIITDKTKEFFTALMQQEEIAQIYKTSRGRNGLTWAHPLVFFDYAMWISPDFKVKVYKWLHDNLTIFRDDSGESYKQMASILQDKVSPAKIGIELPTLAKDIKNFIGCSDWNSATESQLKHRDEIHKSVILLLKAGVSLNKVKEVLLEIK